MWKVAADPKASSTLNVVVQTPPCPGAGCFQMRLSERFIYDYPDLATCLRVRSPGSQGVEGAVFIVKDSATSQKIHERKRAAIRESGAQVVATSCPACMVQIKNGLCGEVDVRHMAELVNEASEE